MFLPFASLAQKEQKTIFQSKAFTPPKYACGQTLSYVDPQARKGGKVSFRVGKVDFNSFNPFLFNKWPATFSENLYASLMAQPLDDPTNLYAYAALSFEEGDHFIQFTLRDGITFSDESPITALDVKKSFELLKEKGSKTQQALFSEVEAEVKDFSTVRFESKEIPLTADQKVALAQLPLFSLKEGPEKGLQKPVTSGPYEVASFQKNQYVTYKRRERWWGEALWINRHLYNFNDVTCYYIPNEEIAFQAFKNQKYTLRRELNPLWWRHRYEFQAVKEGRVKRKTLPNPLKNEVYGLFFNTKSPLLTDRNVRRALRDLFEFEPINQTRYAGAFVQHKSHYVDAEQIEFQKGREREIQAFLKKRRQDFEKEGCEAAEREKDILPENKKERLQKALEGAGWILKKGAWIQAQTGEKAELKVIALIPYHKDVLQDWVDHLKALGIKAVIKMVSPAEYYQRLERHAYDALVAHGLKFHTLEESVWALWGAGKDSKNTNMSQVSHPFLNQLIERLRQENDTYQRKLLLAAIDSVVMAEAYVIPLWVRPHIFWASWEDYGIPKHPLAQNHLITWYAKGEGDGALSS